MQRVQTHFGKKIIFFRKKSFLLTIGKWKGIFLAFGKKTGQVSRRQSTCWKGWVQAEVCLKKHFPFHRFRTLRKWFFVLWKNGQNVANAIYAFMGTVWWKFWLEKLMFFYRFGHLEIRFRFFAESFSKPLSELLFNCPKENFQEIFSPEKSVFHLVTMSKSFWHFVAEFFGVVWKTAFFVSRGTIWGRMYLLFWKNSCFSFRFRTLRVFLRLQEKEFWQCCQNCILRVHRKI